MLCVHGIALLIVFGLRLGRPENRADVNNDQFTDTPSRFINTGINSEKAGITEPFVWAGPWPMKNHKVNPYLISLPPGLDMQLTTFAIHFAHSSRKFSMACI